MIQVCFAFIPCFFVDAFLRLQTFPFSRASPTYTFSAHISASHAAGGEPPLPMHSGATHPCTNSAARAAGGESPPLRAHLGDPHPAQVPQLERPRRAHAPLSLSRHSPWQSRVPNAAHPTHMYTLPSPFPSTSGPMADREVKRTAHVRGLSENALSRQMHTGFSFFPCHATHNGQYPMCSLALISSQGRGRPRTLMLPV